MDCGIHSFGLAESADFISLAVEEEVFIVFEAAVVFNLNAATIEDVAELFALLTIVAVEAEARFPGKPFNVSGSLSKCAARHLVEFLVLQDFVL